ncbi:hypothetical protein WA026_008681 [Henosepilachna vigintioctopunctata]|uniref:SAP domain-containing protein n=1 Tax=Henosepilachna vigintioctopunctata TaxID=420089 RepID=A0AAW1VCW9_9CUCU
MGLTTDISKMKVPELKKELKQRGLNTSGNKNELVERLQEAMKSPGVSTEISSGSLESDILEDDLLNDDDDEQPNTSETALDSDVEKALEDSTVSTDNFQNKTKDNSNGIETKTKKIKLQRDIPSIELLINSNRKLLYDNSDDSLQPKSKVIKLSGISVKERLELRAKKFGVELSGTAKLLARAERFGSLENGSKTSEWDKLQKRAERFGGSVAKEMTNLEMKQKLDARKARFASSK